MGIRKAASIFQVMSLKATQQDFYNHLNSIVPLWIYADHPIQRQVLQLLHIPNNKEKRDE